MQWLARLEIDTDRAMQEGMIDTYSWHKKLWQCFPDDPEATRDFLSRVDYLEGKLCKFLRLVDTHARSINISFLSIINQPNK